MDLVAYRPLRNAPRLSALITAIGVSLGLQNLARIIWGAKPRPFANDTLPAFLRQGTPPSEQLLPAFTLTDTAIAIPGGAFLPYRDLSIIILALVLMIALNRIVSLTKIGKAMRACAQNRVAANLMGINTNRVIAITFAIGSALGAAAGIMVGVREIIEPTMGYYKGVAAFAAAVLGGIGNITGAMLGGLLIGFAEVFGAGYIPYGYGSGYRVAIAYIVMIVVIIIRPSGLFGKSTATRA